MLKDNHRKSKIFLRGVLASSLAALLVASFNYIIGDIIDNVNLTAFLSALIGFALVLLLVKLRFVNIFEIIGSRYLGQHTGIVKVYPSLSDATQDLQNAFNKANRIDLLLHIGRREFGIRESLFSEILSKRVREDPDVEIRILHIAADSIYLSDERARRLGKSKKKWIRDVQYVRDQILEISGGAENVLIASHQEPFIWRLFMFDDEIYVSGYLYNTQNDVQAPVFKIIEGENSLYGPFSTYYNHLWSLYADS